MFDPGQVFRRALSWLPSNFVSVDQAALAAPREFASVDHLSIEAVAAFVDGELPLKAHMRAASHLEVCQQCAGEVDAQRQARSALRDSKPISVPSTLMGLLTAIPESAPEEPAGPDDPDVPGPHGGSRGRRKRR